MGQGNIPVDLNVSRGFVIVRMTNFTVSCYVLGVSNRIRDVNAKWPKGGMGKMGKSFSDKHVMTF